MTFKKPAHKETDPMHTPGQIKNDITLADYIERKTKHDAFEQVAQEKKLTFDEYYRQTKQELGRLAMRKDGGRAMYYHVWKAAQENK